MKTKSVFSRVTRFALLTVTTVFAFGVSRVAGQENRAAATNNPKWNYDELMNVPERARARQNPLEGDPDAVRAGGKLFERHCSECHGMKAEGGKRGPSLLRREVQQAAAGTLFWVLTNGVVWHGMPVWSKLPEPQRWQIVAFLKSFKASAGQSPPALPEPARYFVQDQVR
jgi:mono/diheme cytochrome c family protein